jgi:hypothetical protein
LQQEKKIRINILINSYQIMHWPGLFGQKHLKLYSILSLLSSGIRMPCTSSILLGFDRVKMLHEAPHTDLFHCVKLALVSISNHLERIILGCSQQGKAIP